MAEARLANRQDGELVLGRERLEDFRGRNRERLAGIKAAFDPDGLFSGLAPAGSRP